MSTRTTIIEATAALLAASPSGDISTRAICDAAHVQQPTLYRIFGDKDGLLAATADFGFESYLAGKRAAVPSEDPVADLTRGWDAHTGFALSHPNLYRLIFAPGLGTEPKSVAEAHELLTEILKRCAEAGKLAVPVSAAAKMVLAANSGVALALITRPEFYGSDDVSARVRDATIKAIVVDGSLPAGEAATLQTAAVTLRALLRSEEPAPLTEAERMLLAEWLDRLAIR
ncbi:hypothetical protein ASE16_02550 [Leifsonia sp. Root227]|uniref:TetR/AcrR family transcriptional regulator n=1 Tax=Leifsonia sp. Root227 TaxID=1736496 RepID=UPI0006F9374F|nr:TetR/AcrR family transcriptional regulator [Leifsonia sp. Root227]KRC51964.1 hypothetical protein ASE16_02550 [Leifsonia sp. Root227]